MKNLLKVIPLLAFLLGITAALASQLADDEVATKQALITQSGQDMWVNIDVDDQEGIDYECDLEPERECTRSLNEQGQVITNLTEFGSYRPL